MASTRIGVPGTTTGLVAGVSTERRVGAPATGVRPANAHHRVAAVTRANSAASRSRIPRITRLMALAIKFQEMVARGEVRDYADLARLGYVTRARVTQIMNLALLAPDLQEELLFATEAAGITERFFRQIITPVDWDEQRRRWKTPDTGNQKPIMSPESGTRRATKIP